MSDTEPITSEHMSLPILPIPQLEEILAEVVEVLEELPAVAAIHALYVQVSQCRAAIAASRRHQFSDDVKVSLSAKVLQLETDALSARRALLGRARRQQGRNKRR